MEKKLLIVCEKSTGYKYQGPRYKRLGPYSGEEFREKYLIPWLDSLGENDEAVIDFSNTVVYMPSFLEESFGGAIRKNGINKEKLRHIKFVNMNKLWEKKLLGYITNAVQDAEK